MFCWTIRCFLEICQVYRWWFKMHLMFWYFRDILAGLATRGSSKAVQVCIDGTVKQGKCRICSLTREIPIKSPQILPKNYRNPSPEKGDFNWNKGIYFPPKTRGCSFQRSGGTAASYVSSFESRRPRRRFASDYREMIVITTEDGDVGWWASHRSGLDGLDSLGGEGWIYSFFDFPWYM